MTKLKGPFTYYTSLFFTFLLSAALFIILPLGTLSSLLVAFAIFYVGFYAFIGFIEFRQKPPWLTGKSDEPDTEHLQPLFSNSWFVVNSPSLKIPSHGTHLFAQTYGIDFAPDRGQQPMERKLKWLSLPHPDTWPGFGEPVLSPVSGTVVDLHETRADRRLLGFSWLGFAFFMVQQLFISFFGIRAMIGNYLLIKTESGRYLVLAHLKQYSSTVKPGDTVHAGQVVAECGNSGNSTEPHIHMHVMDSPDILKAKGIPFRLSSFEQQKDEQWVQVDSGIPGPESEDDPAWTRCRTVL